MNVEEMVFVESSELPRGNEIKAYLLRYAIRRGLRIRINRPYRNTRPPYSGSEYDLQIDIGCAPEERGWTRIEYAYGHKLQVSQRNTLIVTRESEFREGLIYDTSGQAVALIAGKTLYILFDLARDFETVDWGSFVTILGLILEDYFLSIDDRERFEIEMKRRKVINSRKRFCDTYFYSRNEVLCTALEIEELQREMESDKGALNEAIRQWRQLFQKEIRKSYSYKEAEALFHTLSSLSATGKIVVMDRSIVFPVGQVDIKENGVWRDIGELVLAVDMFQENLGDGVKCFNLTRTIDGHAHPHANDEGYLCLGNVSDACDAFYRNGEIVLLILVLIDFLRTYSDDNPFKKIGNWPERDQVERR